MNTAFLSPVRSGDVYGYNDIVELIETVLMPDGIKMGKPLSNRDAVPHTISGR